MGAQGSRGRVGGVKSVRVWEVKGRGVFQAVLTARSGATKLLLPLSASLCLCLRLPLDIYRDLAAAVGGRRTQWTCVRQQPLAIDGVSMRCRRADESPPRAGKATPHYTHSTQHYSQHWPIRGQRTCIQISAPISALRQPGDGKKVYCTYVIYGLASQPDGELQKFEIAVWPALMSGALQFGLGGLDRVGEREGNFITEHVTSRG
ncbi:hypothetical protein EDC01DRAFT_223642 [Geopyxis carbonaria]|nr:hypothetical protein EDC01DRAFT_223642 [Geopyxis carbonaria]